MSAFSEQLAATHRVLGEQVPETVANLTRPPAVAGAPTWSGSGLIFPLVGDFRYAADGSMIRDGFRVAIDAATLDPWEPEQGDLLRVQVGDDASAMYVVDDKQMDPTRAILMLTVRKRFDGV